ncbi:SNF2 family amine-terminal domain protein [Gregarina niphandrodes]|uniref:SNF2 family amine-terminal domain protein n=1 Tax=Gregarina niphandrodes TaxID=110365 RepID=A0A023B8U0_GRENI|nr:SNF2 family amine-terminal domain protein [Gregarina niphandrodes]EZG70296.1 SNF2 family amine-terminal domain protein [Gregarina niphandrodes]|eukprot:XP_011129958.1 SNF2 family amine-terminal domain protein [Gregarina niphandrodes]
MEARYRLQAAECVDPLPRMWAQLQCAAETKYYCTLDMTSGFRNVPMKEGSKPLTAFITPIGLFEFNVIPFGKAISAVKSLNFEHKELKLEKTEDVERLQNVLRPLMLRRMKEDVERSIPLKEETINHRG